MTSEHERMVEAREKGVAWRRWGPYLSERQWGTVREDTSADGNAWESFSHDQARSRAYRWGEDGIAGISDDKQRLCFALALWNGRDPILKERLFGLTNGEGNHGEDVKEYYFYLDSTPTHSWMRYLYKYPQAAFPYDDLVTHERPAHRARSRVRAGRHRRVRRRSLLRRLCHYAKASPDRSAASRSRSTIAARSRASLHVLPTLWFRNTWSWGGRSSRDRRCARSRPGIVEATHPTLGTYWLACQGAPPLLFTENETNTERLWGRPNASAYVKDGINAFVVDGRRTRSIRSTTAPRSAADYPLEIEGGGSSTNPLATWPRWARSARSPNSTTSSSSASTRPTRSTRPRCRQRWTRTSAVARQAFAGLLWTKQYYSFDVSQWLTEHGFDPFAAMDALLGVRNAQWPHLVSDDIISMPDKWEYPWYAAWDLAFHATAFAVIDLDFAKQQLRLLLRHEYLHPNGQLPAYEWSFDDVNPPVHAWAAYFIYNMERRRTGHGDLKFLRYAFEKLMLNFTWWVNRKDPSGSNVFQGGFLGLDNIGIFDRSQPLPTGGYIEQADGTAWMAFYCQMMLAMALELAPDEPLYEELAAKFLEQGLRIVAAMDRVGDLDDELWDEAGRVLLRRVAPAGRPREAAQGALAGRSAAAVRDGRRPARDGAAAAHVQSARGLDSRASAGAGGADGADRHAGRGRALPVLGARRAQAAARAGAPARRGRVPEPVRHSLGVQASPGRAVRVQCRRPGVPGWLRAGGVDHAHVRRQLELARTDLAADQHAGDSRDRADGDVLRRHAEGRAADRLRTPSDVGRGRARAGARLERIFLRDADGRRPVYGGTEKFQTDPHWRDLVLFYEYFHGDNGAGIGASHQTGWTALVALLSCYFNARESTGSTAWRSLGSLLRRGT